MPSTFLDALVIEIIRWKAEARAGINKARFEALEKRVDKLEQPELEGWLTLLSNVFFAASIFFPTIVSVAAVVRMSKIAKAKTNAAWVNDLGALIKGTPGKTFTEGINKYIEILPGTAEAEKATANLIAAKVGAIKEATDNTGEFYFSAAEKLITGSGKMAKKIGKIADIIDQLENQLDDMERGFKNKANRFAEIYSSRSRDEAIKSFVYYTWGENYVDQSDSRMVDATKVRNYYTELLNLIMEYVKNGYGQPHTIYRGGGTRMGRVLLAQVEFQGLHRIVPVYNLTEKIHHIHERPLKYLAGRSFYPFWHWDAYLLKDYRDSNGFIFPHLENFLIDFQARHVFLPLPQPNYSSFGTDNFGSALQLANLESQEIKFQQYISSLLP